MTIFGWFADQDQLGVPPTLNYKGKKQHGTCIGGFNSFCLSILVFALTIQAWYDALFAIEWNISYEDKYLPTNNTEPYVISTTSFLPVYAGTVLDPDTGKPSRTNFFT